MGGADAVVAKARRYVDDGDLRFAAAAAQPRRVRRPGRHGGAQELLADVYERLGHGAENGTWRNFYLIGRAGAARRRPCPPIVDAGRRTWPRALTRRAALRLDRHPRRRAARRGTRAWRSTGTFTDLGERYPHDAVQRRAHPQSDPDARPTARTSPSPSPRRSSSACSAGGGLDGIEHDRRPRRIQRLLVGVLDAPDLDFAIVTP